jgi:hypothetical protein
MWRRAERALDCEAGRAPTFEEMASSLRMSASQKLLVAKALQARQLKSENGIDADIGRWSPDELIDRHEAPEAVLEADDERAQGDLDFCEPQSPC